jgi:hypothetical protein
MNFLPLLGQVLPFVSQFFGGGPSSCRWCARDNKWECSQGCPNGQGSDGCCVLPAPPPVQQAQDAATTATTGTGGNVEDLLARLGLTDLLSGTTPASATAGAGAVGAGSGQAVPQDSGTVTALTGAAPAIVTAAPASPWPLLLALAIVAVAVVWYLTHRQQAPA